MRTVPKAEMKETIIRPYQVSDRGDVWQIAYDTAFLGNSGKAFFDDQELLEDFLTGYFLDYEPESCFVAEQGKNVIGYLMGAKDTRINRPGLVKKLLFKTISCNALFHKKNAVFVFNCLKSFLRGEFKAPDFSCDYPATLHINIKEGFRSQGIGAKLITAYIDYLKKEKVRGVHFATVSSRAASFYDRLGFSLLHKAKRTYFKHILKEDIYCYIYGKSLTSFDL